MRVDEAHDPHFRRFLAGSCAGVVSVSVTYPLDLARARMAITDKCGYRNIWDVFMSIYTKEYGAKALFRGYLATVIGVVPYAGTSFFTNETLKSKYCRELRKEFERLTNLEGMKKPERFRAFMLN